jgi:phytanoyl-CoA hydroxylase
MPQLRTALRKITRRQPPPAPVVPATPTFAWFDQPGAYDEIARRASSEADRQVLRSWIDGGYAIVEGLVAHDLIDAMLADLDGLLDEGREPIDGLTFLDLVLPEGERTTTTHQELLELPYEARVAARARSNWRIHQLWEVFASAEALLHHPEIERIASMILGVDTTAHFSINFHIGSAQDVHEDTAVFHLAVPTLICGVWIACEDIQKGCGPLLYYPGSHKRELFAGFDNYPWTNLRTADAELTAAYEAYLEEVKARHESTTFLGKKGDVLFWHGMLLHGGEPIRNPELTRRSFVTHFIPDGIDVALQVTGPTNW